MVIGELGDHGEVVVTQDKKQETVHVIIHPLRMEEVIVQVQQEILQIVQ